MRSPSRRDFLHDSTLLTAALAAVGATSASVHAEDKEETKKIQPNDQLRVAIVGVNGRGMDHVGGIAGKHNTLITHVCDVDEGVIGRAMKSIEEKQKTAPKYEKDIRKVLEDKTVDVVTIATPNHWHALIGIW